MFNAFNVLIVDDEYQSRKLVTTMLSRFFPEISSVAEASAVQEAIELISTRHPKLVFLDIHMQHENGFDLLDKLGPIDFEVIFITAHNDFAVKAFRYNALDYLMKPIDAEDFQVAVNKAIRRLNLDNKAVTAQFSLLKEQWKNPKKLPDRVIIPTAEGYLVIPVKDICYCHASSNYTEFYMTGNTRVTSGYNIGQYEEILQEHNFFRVHRSYLINLAHVKMYRKGEGGTVVMSDGKEIEISRSNKEAFMKFFKG